MLEEARNTLRMAIVTRNAIKSDLKALNLEYTAARSQDKTYYDAIKQASELRKYSDRSACDAFTIYHNNLDTALQELRERDPNLAANIYRLEVLISETKHKLRYMKRDVELHKAVWMKIGEEEDDNGTC